MSNEFKVGDRVRVAQRVEGSYVWIKDMDGALGEIGKISHIKGDACLIDFDKAIPVGRCYFPLASLQLLTEFPRNQPVVVEKGIPLPRSKRRVGGYRQSKYPFSVMQVGDSFYVGPEKKDEARVRHAVDYFRNNNPRHRFTIRQCKEGYRCWRVK